MYHSIVFNIISNEISMYVTCILYSLLINIFLGSILLYFDKNIYNRLVVLTYNQIFSNNVHLCSFLQHFCNFFTIMSTFMVIFVPHSY